MYKYICESHSIVASTVGSPFLAFMAGCYVQRTPAVVHSILTHILLETSWENLLYVCKIRIEEKETKAMQSRCSVWLCLTATKLLKREILGSKGRVDGVYSLLGCNAGRL
jgi:hypothetical protein